ncbi:hypothetical protein Glove_306g49 [Diversispora epigaea]|uniref:Uncharacterized protein n=1 Tax=Diversispora epigaea TaxID=1348612 RepID=A0A397HUV3_9GLOM|nr:hypothetical protein Glove_306g49 [Diversispora epigaea]
MVFKRIHGKTNEWKVFAYSSQVQKTKAHKNLFENLFRCIEKDTGENFDFHYIHGKGLGCSNLYAYIYLNITTIYIPPRHAHDERHSHTEKKDETENAFVMNWKETL